MASGTSAWRFRVSKKRTENLRFIARLSVAFSFKGQTACGRHLEIYEKIKMEQIIQFTNGSSENHDPRNKNEAMRSIFLLKSQPMSGLWLPQNAKLGFDQHHRWEMRDRGICWKPCIPTNAQFWGQRIQALAKKADEKRHSNAFLKLSKTQQHTQPTWSLRRTHCGRLWSRTTGRRRRWFR